MATQNLPGVRIGPLDPDRAENFGTVAAGANSARQLLRHHVAMHPPQLVRALSAKRHEERTAALDRDEAEDAIRRYYADADGEDLPDDARITGVAVHGEDDDADQWLGFTYELPSGRSGKGFVPYSDDYVPNSIEDGHEAVRIAEAKKSGLPWEPKFQRARESDELSREVSGRRRRRTDDDDDDDAEKAELRDRVAELESRLAEVEATPPEPDPDSPEAGTPPSDSGVVGSPQNTEGGSGDVPAPDDESEDDEPFDGYDSMNAPDLRRRIGEMSREEAEQVAAYERAHQDRSTVVSAAEQRVDRAGNGS